MRSGFLSFPSLFLSFFPSFLSFFLIFLWNFGWGNAAVDFIWQPECSPLGLQQSSCFTFPPSFFSLSLSFSSFFSSFFSILSCWNWSSYRWLKTEPAANVHWNTANWLHLMNRYVLVMMLNLLNRSSDVALERRPTPQWTCLVLTRRFWPILDTELFGLTVE